MRRNAHMFVKFTSVKLLMIDHTAVYDTGYILRIQFDRKHLIYIDDKNSRNEMQYLLIRRWGLLS